MCKRTKALLAFLFVAIVAAAVECMYLCPTRLQVVEHRVALPGWPKDCAETRVVVLSDFHAAAGQREWIERFVQQSLALQPELVLLLGDYVAAPCGLSDMPMDELAALLCPLAEQARVMYVCGNHDGGFLRVPDIRPHLDQAGFTCIEKLPAQRITFANGEQADIKGSPMPFTYEEICCHYSPIEKGREAPLIAVQHDPYHFLTRPLVADLVVSGHTHGGQFCLPGGWPMVVIGDWTPSLLRAGLRRGHMGQPVVISRGLGESTLPMRSFCPPEIVLLRLTGSGQALPAPQE